MFTPPSEPMLTTALCANLIDTLADAADAEVGLGRIDAFRLLLAGPGIFSIQQNVTTASDPVGEVLLQRRYSSSRGSFPVEGRKRKTRTPWTEALFLRREIVVSEGDAALARHFDDHAQLRPLGIQRGLNIPMLRENVCYATFNVFGTRSTWQADEIAAMRLLALLAARWVHPAPGLSYTLESGTFAASMQPA